MMTKTKQARAVLDVKVSQVGSRDGERFASPKEQRERIEDACKRGGLNLLRIV